MSEHVPFWKILHFRFTARKAGFEDIIFDKPNPWYATKTLIDGEESFETIQEESILKDYIEGKGENGRCLPQALF